ncbi:MAG: DUF167 domain-containing protein, partial [Dehalococcoidia bacterium]
PGGVPLSPRDFLGWEGGKIDADVICKRQRPLQAPSPACANRLLAQGCAEMDVFMLQVRVTPRAARDQIVGWQDDTLRVRVTAPPLEGRANEAVLRLLARALAVSPSRLRIVRGQTQRNKVVAVEGLSEEEVRFRLNAEPPKLPGAV